MTTQHTWPRSRWVPPGGQSERSGGVSDAVTGPEPAFLTVQEVADLLRVSPGTIRAWIAKGEGPPMMRFGKQIRYRPERVMEWVEQQEGGPG